MQRSKIEWTDYTINPIKGKCPMACSYCYARRLYDRFNWNPNLRINYDELLKTRISDHIGYKIFWGSTMEIFGDWIPQGWVQSILDYIRTENDLNTHIFLTKQPQNLNKYQFPDNCWVGVSTTGFDCRSGLEDTFASIKAKVKFVSIEPLLDYSPMDFRWVDWIIVGRQSPKSTKTKPRLEWIRDIVESADIENKPVFLKNNLRSMLPEEQPFYSVCDEEPTLTPRLRQEFPKC